MTEVPIACKDSDKLILMQTEVRTHAIHPQEGILKRENMLEVQMFYENQMKGYVLLNKEQAEELSRRIQEIVREL